LLDELKKRGNQMPSHEEKLKLAEEFHRVSKLRDDQIIHITLLSFTRCSCVFKMIKRKNLMQSLLLLKLVISMVIFSSS
jgi:hypothetical protein